MKMNTVVSADLTWCKKPKLLQRFARLRILRAEVRSAAAPSQAESATEFYCSAHIVDKSGRKVATPTADYKTDAVKVCMCPTGPDLT